MILRSNTSRKARCFEVRMIPYASSYTMPGACKNENESIAKKIIRHRLREGVCFARVLKEWKRIHYQQINIHRLRVRVCYVHVLEAGLAQLVAQ